jgi:acetoin utilization deacetylase AcuC-like enzyme
VAAILDAIAASHPDLTVEPSPKVPEFLVGGLHDPQYVAMLDRAATTGGGYLDPDTYITPDSMGAARTAAGGLVEGVNRVIDGRARHAIAIVRPPGHHAERARAMGFCLINNVGIAVLAARERQVQRIAILDFDVHHGNGTQHSFEEDPQVLYTSTHQFPFYPGTGRASERGAHGNVINVPLAAGSGDVPFLDAWEKKVGAAIDAFKPELLLVSAGFDAHRDDPLAGLNVTTAGYRRLAELIEGWARKHTGGRTVWALEGGYNLAALGESVVACLDSLRNTAGGDRPA